MGVSIPSPTTVRPSACARSTIACTNAVRSRPRADAPHERAVDLERLHRQVLEQRERRVAGSEVVEREVGRRARSRRGARAIISSRGPASTLSVISSVSAEGSSPERRRAPPRTSSTRPGRRTCRGDDVDAHAEPAAARKLAASAPPARMPRRAPSGRCRRCVPVSSASADELGGREQPTRRDAASERAPRRRRWRPSRARRCGWYWSDELLLDAARGAGPRRARAGRRSPSSILGAYTTYCALPLAFARYIATLARAQQLVRVVADRDPDARGDEHLAALDLERRLEAAPIIRSAASTAAGEPASAPRRGSRTRPRRGARRCGSAQSTRPGAARPPAAARRPPGGRSCR